MKNRLADKEFTIKVAFVIVSVMVLLSIIIGLCVRNVHINETAVNKAGQKFSAAHDAALGKSFDNLV